MAPRQLGVTSNFGTPSATATNRLAAKGRRKIGTDIIVYPFCQIIKIIRRLVSNSPPFSISALKRHFPDPRKQ
jgi:hypothetical protein